MNKLQRRLQDRATSIMELDQTKLITVRTNKSATMGRDEIQPKTTPTINIFYQNADKRYEATLDMAGKRKPPEVIFMLTSDPYVSKDGNVPGFSDKDSMGAPGSRALIINRTRRTPSWVLSSTTKDITVCALDLEPTPLLLVCAYFPLVSGSNLTWTSWHRPSLLFPPYCYYR